MRSAIRWGLGSVLVVASGAGAAWLAFGLGRADTASNVIEDAVPSGFIDPDQLLKYRDLTAQQRAAIDRVAKKMEAATDLLQGRLAFPEAAARFREISQSDPVALAFLRVRFPAATEEELYYRNVIGFVRGFARTKPDLVSAMSERLEAEVRRRFPVSEKEVNVPGA